MFFKVILRSRFEITAIKKHPRQMNPQEAAVSVADERVDGRTVNRTSLFWFLPIVVLFIAARLWRLTASCLWFDEIFSVHAARHTWTELFHFIAADIIHPPLFYVLLKIWIAIGGESLAWLRLFPALISVAAIVPFMLLGRELKLRWSEMHLALFLLAVNGYLIKYAQDVRMYSLLFLLSLISLWLFFRSCNREHVQRSDFIWLCSVNLLLIYTHYAGWLMVVLQAVVLLVWQRRKLSVFLIHLGLLVIAYLPWIYAVIKLAQAGVAGKGLVENIGWVSRPGISDLVQYFVLLNRPFLFVQSSAQAGYNFVIVALAIALFAVPLLLFLGKVRAERADYENSTIVVLSVFTVAPVVLAFVISWISSYSFWGTRHLIIAAGPYAILAALALKRLRPAWARISTFTLIGSWVLLSAAIFLFSRPPTFIWCSWEQLATQMAAVELNSGDQVRVYAYEDLVAYHLWFALDGGRNKKFQIGVVKGVPGMPEDPAYFLPRAFTDISTQRNPLLEGNEIWVAFRAKQWDETRPPLHLVRSQGFAVDRVLTVKSQGQDAFLVQLKRVGR